MLIKCSWVSICKKGYFLIVALVFFQTLNAQKLVDYLDVATKNFVPQLEKALLPQNRSTTQLEFGYFVDPQYTVSGAQKAYVSFMQEVPWLGKSAAYLKVQKNNRLREEYLVEQQKEELKFKVKELYYQLYQYQYQKDAYLVLADKFRKHINTVEKDTLKTSAKTILKLFEQKQLLIEFTEKVQLIDGGYQNVLLRFNALLKQDSFQEVELPLELAMPTEDQTMSFSDAYENPLYIAYEHELLTMRQAQKYSNKWLPTLSLGLRYAEVVADDLVVELPAKDIIEPRLQLKWDLFSRTKKVISKQVVEAQSEQKILDMTSLLQMEINNQISARISYFTALDKLEQLKKLKAELLKNNVSLNVDELIRVEFLETTYKVEEIKAITDYYVSSSKMLLYQ